MLSTRTNDMSRGAHALMTDSKSIFDITSEDSSTNEKRIMIDIHSARRAYRAHEVSNIGFVRSENNIADGLTKLKMQSALLNLLRTGKYQVKCEQWIIRPTDLLTRFTIDELTYHYLNKSLTNVKSMRREMETCSNSNSDQSVSVFLFSKTTNR